MIFYSQNKARFLVKMETVSYVHYSCYLVLRRLLTRVRWIVKFLAWVTKLACFDFKECMVPKVLSKYTKS